MRSISLLLLMGCGEVIKEDVTNNTEEGEIQVDSDGDGYLAGEDCDDSNAYINPAAEEICDGLDNDCDNKADEDVQLQFFADSDNDGFGSSNITIEACEVPNGFVTNGSDCDDNDGNSYPGGEEVCDERDNDCNGQVDDNLGQSFYVDLDGDGYGNPNATQEACFLDFGLSTLAGDCDDQNPAINPGGEEVCNEIDDNCDGDIDEEVAQPFYADLDGDAYGDGNNILYACSVPIGYVQNTLDCNDSDSLINPAGDEYCDSVDNDCDGHVDEDFAVDAEYFYEDNDSDGFGNAGSVISACFLPNGYVRDNTDCDDNNAVVRPNSTEFCNGYDDNCNGSIDEVGALGSIVYYPDNDGDQYGDTDGEGFCSQPEGYVLNNTDCDDNDNDIYPLSEEICNGEDDDCDGLIDENTLSTFYIDEDGDGYGSITDETQTESCSVPSGYSALSTDCDDTTAEKAPNNTEICDEIDNNCNGSVDENIGNIYYADEDNDTYGDPNNTQQSCSMPEGFVVNSTDCNDNNNEISPAAEEICNDIDDDCNGFVDEGSNIPYIVYYLDNDDDGYGDPETAKNFCSAPNGYVTNNLDCDDNDDDVKPFGTEYCNEEDDDCNGQIDDDAVDTKTWYKDVDGDGFAGIGVSIEACTAPENYYAQALDCNDNASTGFDINPDATEIFYDGVDQNCDGENDYDQDGDGVVSYDYGGEDCYDDDASTTEICSIFEFTSHTFTSCGVTGREGPTYDDCVASYNTDDNWHLNTDYYDMFTQGIQVWTVPKTGTYRIAAVGASGHRVSNSLDNSYGAYIQADVNLEAEQKLLLLVGQMGAGNAQHGNENGGGGGSFVILDNSYTITNLVSDLDVLIVAGGGGGAPSSSYGTACSRTNGNAQLNTSGKTVSCYGTGQGGTNGSGGSSYAVSASYAGGGGGGMFSSGSNGWTHCTAPPQGGSSFMNGGVGGFGNTCYSPNPHGGFGGGGAGGLGSPGGGGGYSGGGSAGYWSSYSDYGGGGGSYIKFNATNKLTTLYTNVDDGEITIEFIE